MFSQLLFVRLRAAEQALRAGRIDEAHRLAMAPDLRSHRRGAAVLASLAEQFLERAKSHFRADRFREALVDLDRADSGDSRKEEIAQLRRDIQSVAAAVYQKDEARRARIDAARRNVAEGLVEAGRRLLEEASSGDVAAERLRREIDSRAVEAARLVGLAAAALRQGQTVAAVQHIMHAKALDATSPEVTRAESEIIRHALARASDAFNAGRLVLAKHELEALKELGGNDPARRECEAALATAWSAKICLGEARFAEARRKLLSLLPTSPQAAWLNPCVEQLRQMEELYTTLASGPLSAGDGVSENRRVARAEGAPGARPASEDMVVIRKSDGQAAALPDRLLLLVDGGGSYLIVRGAGVSVGRAAADHPADVPLLGDIAERHANIARVDDDYFIFASKDVEVAGKPTRHQLLRDGDRVVLGRKAKFTFRAPSRRSATAVLDLSDTTKMPNDVRRVVLFQGHATVGEGAGAHIRCRHAGPSLLLFERDGQLWIRQRNDGHVDGGVALLELGRPVEIGGARLVLNTWQVRGRTL